MTLGHTSLNFLKDQYNLFDILTNKKLSLLRNITEGSLIPWVEILRLKNSLVEKYMRDSEILWLKHASNLVETISDSQILRLEHAQILHFCKLYFERFKHTQRK